MAEVDNNAQQVYGIAIGASTGGTNSEFTKDASRVIEYAMTQAVVRAYQDGATEPEAVNARMMFAREEAKKFLRHLDELVYPAAAE